jgi:hypothetical protein
MTKKHFAAATVLVASAALVACVGGSDGAPDESATPTTGEVTTTTTEKPPTTTTTEPQPMTLDEWKSSEDGATVKTWTTNSFGAYTSIFQSLAVGTDAGIDSAIDLLEVAIAQAEQDHEAVAEAVGTAPEPLQGLLTQSQADWETGLEQLYTAYTAHNQVDMAAASGVLGAAARAWTEADLAWEDLLPQL